MFAAGRAIALANDQDGKNADQCRSGTAAVLKVATKYGLVKLPAETLEGIDKKVKKAFNIEG